ncbi:helix-turn-helix domain-containing protein [Qipengyuania sp. ASV99]|uniref:helix-turn-helix domain-containing protein n=1 Tax=Qipengyuania sp. ASV99 TaxID=3399681 RepID=UPI003A4C6CFC
MATVFHSPAVTSMEALRGLVGRDAASSDTAVRLCELGQYRLLPRGGELQADPQDDHLVFIAEGAAKLLGCSVPVPMNRRDGFALSARECRKNIHILAFHFRGEIVSVPQKSKDDFRLAALCDMDVIVFSANRFLDIAQDDPTVIRNVLTRSLEALHRSRTRMLQIGHQSARQRVASFLVAMAERLCCCADGACELVLPMSRGDIGDSLGLTIETVSRQFADLRAEGLITTHGRSIVRLMDIGRLIGETSRSAKPQPHRQT